MKSVSLPMSTFRGILLAVVIAAVACTRLVSAQCRVVLRGETTREWSLAAEQVEGRRGMGDDCESIIVDIEAEQARVVFTTRSGRRAERTVKSPSEMVATVSALRVTGLSVLSLPGKGEPAEEEPSSGKASRAAPRAVLPSPSSSFAGKATTAPDSGGVPPDAGSSTSRAVSSEASPSVGSPRGPRVMVGLGVRAGAGRLISPLEGGSMTLSLRDWEIGVTLSLEPHYFTMENRSQDDPVALGAGIVMGRREPIGPASVAYGGRVVVASVRSNADSDSEVRIGPYVGVILADQERLRLRSEVAVDVVPQDIGGAAEGDIVSPWWAVALLLGVEFGGS